MACREPVGRVGDGSGVGGDGGGPVRQPGVLLGGLRFVQQPVDGQQRDADVGDQLPDGPVAEPGRRGELLGVRAPTAVRTFPNWARTAARVLAGS